MISLERLKQSRQILYTGRLDNILANVWQTTPKRGGGQGPMTHFQFRCPQSISEIAEARVAKFCGLVECTKC